MRLKWKRSLALGSLTLVLGIVLAACGGDDPTPTATSAPPTPTATSVPPTATPTPLPPGVTPPPAPTPTPVPPPPTPAPPPFDGEAYFGGKTIKLITGTSPGGGYDTFTRIFARFAKSYFPSSTKFVVQNLPGAGQLRGLLAVMNADPDGYTMGPTHQRWVQRQVLVGDVPDFDLANVHLLGTPSFSLTNVDAFCLDRSVGSSWADVLALGRPLLNGETGPGNAPAPEFIEAIGGPIKNVYGYGGTSEIMAAFDRHELDATDRCTVNTVPRLFPEWPGQNRLVPIWHDEVPVGPDWLEAIGVGRDYTYPHVIDFMKTPEFGIDVTETQIAALEAHILVSNLSRMFFLPAGVPDDIKGFWQDAFEKTVTDIGFVEASGVAGYAEAYGYASGAELQPLIDTLNGLPQDLKDIVLRISAIDQLSF